jgi:hypothetical protein
MTKMAKNACGDCSNNCMVLCISNCTGNCVGSNDDNTFKVSGDCTMESCYGPVFEASEDGEYDVDPVNGVKVRKKKNKKMDPDK